ncbi:spexin prohormone 1 isoform 1-T1 [Menidia menidia]
MKGFRIITLTHGLTLLLLAAFISQSWSAPKGSFQRRNWTPQAMLYLKGTQGRRFISEDRKEGDVYDTLHLETRSQNTEKLSVDQAATVLLNFLQQAREGASGVEERVLLRAPIQPPVIVSRLKCLVLCDGDKQLLCKCNYLSVNVIEILNKKV